MNDPAFLSEPASVPLACVVCSAALEPVFVGHVVNGYVQPCAANTFTTSGTYGSTVFDPLDGSCIEVNICDRCLVRAMERGQTRSLGPQ